MMKFISLLELNLLIKDALNAQLESSYWVVAEISELRTAQKGHCYLELVEKEGNFLQAKLKATIWATSYKNINGWFQKTTGESLKSGMKILAHLKVDFHEQYGLTANIIDVDPNFTLGERAKRKQEIIDKLVADGIFELNKMQQIPLAPQRIAIISSRSAAGYGDFVHQLQSNEHGYKFSINLFQAVMQGTEAAKSIVDALYKINDRIDDYDIVAIIRGGGAQVDMDCFDDYDLASHIAQFPIPILSGIGHERDESITDLVAHTKLKTPTAVSSFLISELFKFEKEIETLIQKVNILTKNYCAEQKYKLERITNLMLHYKTRYWEKQTETLSQIQLRLNVFSKNKLSYHKEKISRFETDIKSLSKNYFKDENQKLQYIQNTLNLSDPKLILKKGYTISYIQNKLLKDAKVDISKTLVTMTSTLSIESIITKISTIENGKKENQL